MNDLMNHPVLNFYIKSNHFGSLVGMDFQVEAPGNIIYTMNVQKQHLATPQAAHGGVVCTLMDATMGVCALSNVLEKNQVVSTIEMKISFVSPALLGDILTGTAEIIKSGHRLLFVEGRIQNQTGILIATASGTFNAYPAEKAGFQ